LIKAVARFEPAVARRSGVLRSPIFAAPYSTVRDHSDMARRQDESTVSQETEDDLIQILQRQPTIENRTKAQLTIEQIQNAIDARVVAFARTHARLRRRAGVVDACTGRARENAFSAGGARSSE